MELFTPYPDYEAGRFKRPRLSLREAELTAWKGEDWSPFLDILAARRGPLTSEDIARLQSLFLHIKLDKGTTRHLAGVYDINSGDFVTVSAQMKAAIEALDPGAFQFVAFDEIWDHNAKGKASGVTLYLAWPLRFVDALDKAASDLDPMVSSAPGFFPQQFNGRNRVFRRSGLPDGHFFRDVTTGLGVCTAEFKNLISDVGGEGWIYFPCTVADS